MPSRDHPRDNGLLNSALLHLGLIHQPLQIMRTSLAVYSGIIYSYLPFMVLPLFATLEKLDHSLLEAAADLGSPAVARLLDITLPLSLPGMIAGSMLVFIPAVGEFVIPSLLGGPDNLMIGASCGMSSSATMTGRWPPPWPSPSWCCWWARSRSTSTTT
jgi:putrescine transport system permease protein